MKKKDFLLSIKEQFDQIPDKYFCDFSDSWGSVNRGYIVSVYSLSENFDLHGFDKYEAFDLIYRNRKFFNYYNSWHTGSQYDCTGEQISASFSIHKCSGLLILLKSATYDV